MKPNLVLFIRLTAVALATGLLCLHGATAFGQDKDKNRDKGKRPQTKKIEIPEPKIVTIVTKDNVELRVDYFAGINAKNTVPILLLHEFDGSRKTLIPLAEYLQKEYGHAVLVPDLRGHGESLSIQGIDKPIDRTRFRKNELLSMSEDIEACKRFLMKQNNQGKLNIDLLTIVAMGDTAILSIRWSIADWQWPQVGGLKQGQDVKALVLVSPVKRFQSLDMTRDLKAPLITGKSGVPLSIFLMWGGRNAESSKDGKLIYDAMKKSRPQVDADEGDDSWWEEESLFRVIRQRSKESGSRLVADEADGIHKDVGLFIEKKVVAKKDDYRWQNRQRK